MYDFKTKQATSNGAIGKHLTPRGQQCTHPGLSMQKSQSDLALAVGQPDSELRRGTATTRADTATTISALTGTIAAAQTQHPIVTGLDGLAVEILYRRHHAPHLNGDSGYQSTQ